MSYGKVIILSSSREGIMVGEDIIMVSQRELKRLHIIHKALDGTLKQVEVAEVLLLSDRQVRRIIKRVRIEGDRGVVHKSSGTPSSRRFHGVCSGGY